MARVCSYSLVERPKNPSVHPRPRLWEGVFGGQTIYTAFKTDAFCHCGCWVFHLGRDSGWFRFGFVQHMGNERFSLELCDGLSFLGGDHEKKPIAAFGNIRLVLHCCFGLRKWWRQNTPCGLHGAARHDHYMLIQYPVSWKFQKER